MVRRGEGVVKPQRKTSRKPRNPARRHRVRTVCRCPHPDGAKPYQQVAGNAAYLTRRASTRSTAGQAEEAIERTAAVAETSGWLPTQGRGPLLRFYDYRIGNCSVTDGPPRSAQSSICRTRSTWPAGSPCSQRPYARGLKVAADLPPGAPRRSSELEQPLIGMPGRPPAWRVRRPAASGSWQK